MSGTINPCVLPIGPGGDWWFGLTWLFLLIDRAPALLLPVHPHLVSRADDLATVDVDALAVVDVVADLHVGLADYALAHAGLVSGDVVHETFVMQVQGFALQEDVGRALPALVELVRDRVGHRHAMGGACWV